MNCISGYIGLKNCSLPAPTSGRYVNLLPGISSELADKIANSEQVTLAKVWEDVQELAYMEIKNDIINMLADEVKLNEVVYQTRKLLKTQRNSVEVLAANEYRGTYIMLPESKYSQLRLVEVYIYSKQAVTTTLKVWDINDGSELYTQEINLVIGLNTIKVPIGSTDYNLKYRVQEYFIGVDGSNFDTIETMSDYYFWYDADMACASRNNNFSVQRGYFQFYPGTLQIGAEITYENILKSSIGKGFAIGAEILCSVDQFICENIHHFEESLLYLEGKLLLLQKLNAPLGSTRLNYFTATGKEQTEKTMLDFDFNYKDKLKKKVKSIPLRGESMCFSCEEAARIGYKGNLP